MLFVAPKQATFQLERQILSDSRIKGFSRLHILSFERLARFVLEKLEEPMPELLSEQGRIMVLRALLSRHAEELEIFHKSARRVGFSEELSEQLREFQQYQLSPAAMRHLARQSGTPPKLAAKFRDLAFISERYEGWLKENALRDGDSLLTIASEKLRMLWQKMGQAPFPVGAIWLDGFAQMTPQERELLLALLPCAEESMLAFCLDQCPGQPPWHSPWAVVYQAFDQCRSGIQSRFPNCDLTIEHLPRHEQGRFAAAPLFSHLERNWARPIGLSNMDCSALKVVTCTNFEGEVINCAREVVRYVRMGGRYRDVAVILRDFNASTETIPRILRRYGIPHFLDRRESVSHHPLAELTRGALRALVLGWRIPDLFSTLKSGLWNIEPTAIDQLENEALANGWEGEAWQKSFTRRNGKPLPPQLEELQQMIVRGLNQFQRELSEEPDGGELARAIGNFWTSLNVPDRLQQWSASEETQLHNTVLKQIEELLSNVQRAFAGHRMRLRAWLPILESGLTSLTVGLIPPALDQVLVGAVARSRNPDLKLVFVLGMNEGMFPAPPVERKILTEADRQHLVELGLAIGPVASFQLSEEQFYGYIACTRAREKLILSCSELSADGKPLNRSRFLKNIRDLCGDSVFQKAESGSEHDFDHPSEMLPLYFRSPRRDELSQLLALGGDGFEAVNVPSEADKTEQLQPTTAKALFNGRLYTSATALERFASCPFQFFMRTTLSADERELFELDFKEEGSFKHEVLEAYHNELSAEGKQWRDVTPAEARERVGRLCDSIATTFRGGLLNVSQQNAFRIPAYKASLQDFIAAVTESFIKSNKFNPVAAEAQFHEQAKLKTWKIKLPQDRLLELQGKIDRIDLLQLEDRTLFALIDYKSSETRPKEMEIYHGLKQQLAGYLLTLAKVEGAPEHFKAKMLEPAGFFYASLKGATAKSSSRGEVLGNGDSSPSFKHFGLFNLEHRTLFDDPKSELFHYSINADGTPRARSFAALPPAKFQEVLERGEQQLMEFATRILDGDISVSPSKLGGDMACKRCHYGTVCRYDPWSDTPRNLSLPEEEK